MSPAGASAAAQVDGLYRFEIATKLARGRMRSLRRQLLDDDSPVLRRSAAPTI